MNGAPGERNSREVEALWARPEVQALIAGALEGRSTAEHRSLKFGLQCRDHDAGVEYLIWPGEPSGTAAGALQLRLAPGDGSPASLSDWHANEGVEWMAKTETHRITCGCGAVYLYRPARLLEAALRALVRNRGGRVVRLSQH